MMFRYSLAEAHRFLGRASGLRRRDSTLSDETHATELASSQEAAWLLASVAVLPHPSSPWTIDYHIPSANHDMAANIRHRQTLAGWHALLPLG
jgi:hypothetical protein